MSNFDYDAELRIPSNLIYLRSVRAFVRELAENLGFSRDKVGNVELATDEIFSNAIEHGSSGVDSQIIVRFLTTDEAVKITISDSGQEGGLDRKWITAWSDVVKKNINLGTERGHGLLLAHSLADEMCMESNSIGGLDVHLLWYLGRKSKYKKIFFGCNPQAEISQT